MIRLRVSALFVMLLMTLFVSFPLHAAFTLIHKTDGPTGVQENGMQAVHTDYQILYASPGETVYLYRPERSTFIGYVRWYCYDTDRAVPSMYTAENSPTGVAIPRVETTWIKDTIKFSPINEYGWFAHDYASDRVTTKDSTYLELKYTMHSGDSVYRIACDQGIYKDFSPSTWNSNTAMTEPTLSKRIIFEIRPAKWMADSLELCKVTPSAPNDRYLEEHKMMAPTGRQLYVGPNYMYHTKKIALTQYTYNARSNYYYYNNKGVLTSAGSDNSKWKWYKDGVKDNTITAGTKGAQFATMSSNVPGTFVYTMKYEYATGYAVNVARFTVTYIDVDEVGPSTEVPAPTNKMDLIYEETFNYDRPGTTNFAFWRGHFDVDESTYGYYDKNLDETNATSKRKIRKGQITWSEYAVTNHKEVWVSSGEVAPHVYQHVDGTENVAENAMEGYMLYCDGSQQPGQVFNLKVNADLCPGSTMYFSAWLCDASSTGSGKSAPNMDFVVTGIDAGGNEHALTTFTTGEFGINAVAKVGEDAKMERAKWYKIMFPVKFDAGDTYHTYRLRITNKSTSSDGNDFAIDDIRIYVQKPPVMPIQASTSDCVDKAVDSIRTYLRIDYQEIDHQGDPLYYQWREGNKIVRSPYFNVDSASTTFGKVEILPTDEAIEASGNTCTDLFDFDRRFRDTKVPVVRYIKEQVDNVNERYVMYIAMPMEVRINHDYTGFVAQSPSQLGDRTGCGTFADMLIAGGTRITINDEITYGDEVVTVCGHRDYNLNIVLTAIIQDETQGELRVDTMWCRADWLIGDAEYVDAHPEIYKYSFEQIESYLKFYRQNPVPPAAKQMVDFLKQHGLLTLDTASITMSPGVSLSYTAFPLAGSATDVARPVCTTPRFLHIRPADPASNMMVVGTSAEDDEGLPDVVKNRPRIVRLSDSQRKEGWLDVPLYRLGDEGESYIIERVYAISSTEPNWEDIELIPDHMPMLVQDIIHFGNKEDRNDPANAAIQSLKPGYDYTFHVAFVGESDEDQCDRGYTYFTLRIVPDTVTWLGGNWNEDASWDYAIPMDTTNVILQAQDYNVTFAADPAESYDFNYTRNKCKNIYIPAGASMAGQENLEIRGTAYVDIPVLAQNWALTSVPIKGIVSGDLFVSQNESSDPFTVANINHSGTGTIAHDRYTFEVYDSPYDATENKWIRPDSILDRPIRPGDAVMIGIDCASASATPVIRLPKPDNMYHYYDANSHKWLADNVNITSDLRADLGKPAWNGESTFTLNRAYNGVYLFGNPTFGYIDLTQLVGDNSTKLTGRYYMETDGINALPSGSIDWAVINPDAAHVLLPPCRGVLLEGKSESDQLEINVSTARVSAPATPAPRRTPQYAPFVAGNGTPIGRRGTLETEYFISEWSMEIEEFFEPLVNSVLPRLRIERTLQKNGYFNTLCLPFSLTADEIAASPLAGCEIYTFDYAEKIGDKRLDIYMNEAEEIEAGVPYLVKWADTGELLTELLFTNVRIETAIGLTAGDGIQFVGNIKRGQMVYEDRNNLFVADKNTLKWPNTNNPMRGFRSYFLIPESGPSGVPQGTPARLLVRAKTPTGSDSPQSEGMNVRKIMKNGTLYILRDGKLYDTLGKSVR